MEISRSEPSPSPEEAAALMAAIERFLADTTQPAPPPPIEPAAGSWKRAALIEGISRQPLLPPDL